MSVCVCVCVCVWSFMRSVSSSPGYTTPLHLHLSNSLNNGRGGVCVCVFVCKCPHPCFKFAWLILNFSCIFSLHHVSSHEACTTQRHISTHTNNQGVPKHMTIYWMSLMMIWTKVMDVLTGAQVVKKIKINVDTNISLGRRDERWVQQERVAPTLPNTQCATPEDQMTSFSRHTRWSRHKHVLSMSTSHTWIPNCYTISILLACCPKSYTHTVSPYNSGRLHGSHMCSGSWERRWL